MLHSELEGLRLKEEERREFWNINYLAAVAYTFTSLSGLVAVCASATAGWVWIIVSIMNVIFAFSIVAGVGVARRVFLGELRIDIQELAVALESESRLILLPGKE